MGPRLDNRGWAACIQGRVVAIEVLQWVHGWITVVGRRGRHRPRVWCVRFNGSTVG